MDDKAYLAIYNMLTNLNEQVIGFRKEMKSEMLDLKVKVDGLERRMDKLENRMVKLENRMGKLECKVEKLECKVDKLESDIQEFRMDVSSQFDILVNDRLNIVERRQDLSAIRLDKIEARVQLMNE